MFHLSKGDNMEVEVYSHINRNGVLVFEIEIPSENRLTNPKMILEVKKILKKFAKENEDKMFYK